MTLAYLALLLRILLVGYEKIIVKKLGEGYAVEATLLFFLLATTFMAPSLMWVQIPTHFGFLSRVLVSGFVYSIAFLLFVRSLAIGDASLVGPLYNFNVFFLVFLTAIFLNEPISAAKITGLILLVYGVSFLNRRPGLFHSFKSLLGERACLYMILCSFLMAVGRTIDGFVVREVSPLVYAFALYFAITTFLGIYVIASGKITSTLDLWKIRTKIALVAGFTNAYSYFCLLLAFRKIHVSVAEPASMLGSIVTVVLAHIIFKEHIRDRLTGVFVMLAGACFLFL